MPEKVGVESGAMDMLLMPKSRRQTPEARRRAACARGYHLPVEDRRQRDDGHTASACRYCGVPIVRGIGRYWIFSGVLG
jgi:hypothetical protein